MIIKKGKNVNQKKNQEIIWLEKKLKLLFLIKEIKVLIFVKKTINNHLHLPDSTTIIILI